MLGVFVTTLATISGVGVCRGAIFDAAAQFDASNNPSSAGHWSYGYTGSVGGVFSLFTNVDDTDTGPQWDMPDSYYPDVQKNTGGDYDAYGGFFPANCLTLSPGQGTQLGLYADIRWTAPTSASYSIDTVFTGVWDHSNSFGDVHVVVNGMSVFDGTIDHRSSSPYADSLFLNPGDTVDFVVGHDADNGWVRAIVDTSISEVPEPSTLIIWSLLGGLGIAMGWWRRRKAA
jgi:hypothetical protein